MCLPMLEPPLTQFYHGGLAVVYIGHAIPPLGFNSLQVHYKLYLGVHDRSQSEIGASIYLLSVRLVHLDRITPEIGHP